MSKKDEKFKEIQARLAISTEDLNKIYTDIEKQLKQKKGKDPTEDAVLIQMLIQLSQAFSSNATKHSGIFLGVEDNFGFNQKPEKVKASAMKKYAEDPNLAITEGVVSIAKDGSVIPMWHYAEGVANIQDWQITNQKTGLRNPILDTDYSATVYLILDNKGKLSELKSMQIKGDVRTETLANAKNLVGKKVTFNAIDKEDGSMNYSKFTKFVVEGEVDNLAKLIGKQAKSSCIALKDANDFYLKHGKDFRNIPVFIRVAVAKNTISETTNNNSIEVVDLDYNHKFFVYMAKELGVPTEGSTNVIFGGRLNHSDKNPEVPFSMNAFMFIETEKDSSLAMPESLKKIVETTVTNVEQKVAALEATTEKDKEEDW